MGSFAVLSVRKGQAGEDVMLRCDNCRARVDPAGLYRTSLAMELSSTLVAYVKNHMYDGPTRKGGESADLCESCQNELFDRLQQLAVEFEMT